MTGVTELSWLFLTFLLVVFLPLAAAINFAELFAEANILENHKHCVL
jgi:hypothetical protein